MNCSTRTSSSQASYRLRRVFSFHCKTHRALILLLLASKPDPLSLGSGLVCCPVGGSGLRNLHLFFNTCHKKSSEVIDFRGFLRIDRRYITVKSIFALLNVFCKLHQAYNSLHVWIICPTLMDHETNFISPNTLCRNGFRRFFASKYWRGFL